MNTYNKLFSLTAFLLAVFLSVQVLAQPVAEAVQDIKPLKPGEKVPDIPLKIMNNKTGKTRLSDYKGKLVILDFWYTGCGSCIAGFPKMEKLQKQFGDKIQILLVNSWESEEQVAEKIEKNSHLRMHIPDLPSVIDDTQVLLQLFPIGSGVGQHGWIDKNGSFIANAHAMSTYAQKIEDILEYKPTFFLHDQVYASEFKKNPLIMNSHAKASNVEKSSLFLSANADFGPGSYSELNVVDKLVSTVRNTLINFSVVNLYMYALLEKVKSSRQEVIYNPWISDITPNFLKLEVADSTSYSTFFPPPSYIEINRLYDSKETLKENKFYIDTTYMKSYYSYEQILPVGLSQERIRAEMLDDLNDFFGMKYGAFGSIQKIKVPCFELVYNQRIKINHKDKKPTTKRSVNESEVQLSLKNIIGSAATAFKDQYVFDETNGEADKIIPLTFSKDFSKVEFNELSESLKELGFSLRPSERELDFIVIKENASKER